jgi:hypothetical protein
MSGGGRGALMPRCFAPPTTRARGAFGTHIARYGVEVAMAGNFENNVSLSRVLAFRKNKKELPIKKGLARKNKKMPSENVCSQIGNIALTT